MDWTCTLPLLLGAVATLVVMGPPCQRTNTNPPPRLRNSPGSAPETLPITRQQRGTPEETYGPMDFAKLLQSAYTADQLWVEPEKR